MPRGRASTKTTPKNKKTSPSAVKSTSRKSRIRQKTSSAPLLPAAPSPIRTPKVSRRRDFDPNAIKTYQDFIHAIETESVQITLADNIIVEEDILINHDIAINFNGFSLISEDSRAGARVLDIRSGEVSLIGHGKIFAMGPRSVAIRVFGAISSGVPNYTTLTVDEGISLFAPDSYAILVSPNLGVAYGLTVNFSGRIFARDGICLASGIHGHDPNAPVINLKSSAQITADENLGSAIEAAGYGQWEISASQLRGAIGMNLASGIVQLYHAQIISNSSVFHLLESVAKDLEVTVDGGSYLSENASVIDGSPDSLKSFILKGGAELYSTTDHIAKEVEQKITVRKTVNFRTDIEDFLTNLIVSTPEPGPVVPQPDSTPVSHQTTPELPPESIESVVIPELPIPTELTDQDTDEREIVLALTSEKVERPAPAIIAPPKPANPITNEQEAARLALSDAIADIRKLSAEDYDAGFFELEQAIKKSESLLMDPFASLADISDAASDLLKAFDGLEERDEFSLSDEELDDLFYHGAVLGELTTEIERAKQEKKIKHATRHTPSNPQDILKAAQAEVGFTPISAPLTHSAPVAAEASSAPQPTAPATNFDVLTDVLTTIAELNLSNYSRTSQQSLLSHLATAQEVLSDVNSSQDSVDKITASLLSDIASLEKMQSAYQRNQYYAELSAPAPITRSIIPPTMIDELSPVITWSQGITMIDEMVPFTTTPEIRAKMLRAIQPRLKAILSVISNPFRKVVKSFSAGFQAGFRAYRETLHSVKR